MTSSVVGQEQGLKCVFFFACEMWQSGGWTHPLLGLLGPKCLLQVFSFLKPKKFQAGLFLGIVIINSLLFIVQCNYDNFMKLQNELGLSGQILVCCETREIIKVKVLCQIMNLLLQVVILLCTVTKCITLGSQINNIHDYPSSSLGLSSYQSYRVESVTQSSWVQFRYL